VAEAEALQRAEQEAQLRAQIEAEMRAEAEVRRRAEEDARKRAEDEARRRAQEEAERLAAEQARRAAEEQVRRQAEEEQRRRREEDARRVAQEVAQSRAEENAGYARSRTNVNAKKLNVDNRRNWKRGSGRRSPPSCVPKKLNVSELTCAMIQNSRERAVNGFVAVKNQKFQPVSILRLKKQWFRSPLHLLSTPVIIKIEPPPSENSAATAAKMHLTKSLRPSTIPLRSSQRRRPRAL
jgi:hypothetical protein